MSITLSYTSISGLYEHPHYWLNKMAGIKMPDWDFFTAGKEGHRIIQDHVSGIKLDPRLNISYKFPLVETVDFDPKMNFRLKINEEYEVQGFIDCLNLEELRSMEIKTGSPWSLSKFQKSFQRKIYSLLLPDIKEQLLLSAPADPDKWLTDRPKIFTICPTQVDRDEAMEYILGGIAKIKAADFYGDLVRSESGDLKCEDYRCLYGNACMFKKQ